MYWILFYLTGLAVPHGRDNDEPTLAARLTRHGSKIFPCRVKAFAFRPQVRQLVTSCLKDRPGFLFSL